MLVSQVACETVTKTGMIMVCGEITSKAHVDYQKVTLSSLSRAINIEGVDYQKITQSFILMLTNANPIIGRL